MAGCMVWCPNARALDTSIEIAAGYDDNAVEVPEGEGSGVSRYRVQLAQPVFKDGKGPDLDLYFDAVYSQYFSLEDNYRLRAGTALSVASGEGRFHPGLFTEVVAYRDDLVAEDEYNTLLAGGNLQWLVDARLTLLLAQTFSWVDYQNRVSLPGQRVYGVGKGKGAGGRNWVSGEEPVTFSREDTLWATELIATYYMTPDIQADVSCLYRNASSSADYESYQELGGSVKMRWFCSDVEIFTSGFWSRLCYDAVPEGMDPDRGDDVYGFGLGAGRSVGEIRLFAQFDKTVNDSPVVGEEYEKLVVLCGVTCSF